EGSREAARYVLDFLDPGASRKFVECRCLESRSAVGPEAYSDRGPPDTINFWGRIKRSGLTAEYLQASPVRQIATDLKRWRFRLLNHHGDEKTGSYLKTFKV